MSIINYVFGISGASDRAAFEAALEQHAMARVRGTDPVIHEQLFAHNSFAGEPGESYIYIGLAGNPATRDATTDCVCFRYFPDLGGEAYLQFCICDIHQDHVQVFLDAIKAKFPQLNGPYAEGADEYNVLVSV